LFGLDFAHGLGVAGDSRVDYALGGDRETFRAEAGPADDAAPDARVRFQVYGDEQLLWDSGEVGAGGVVKPVIDIRGVGVLSLRTRCPGAGTPAIWANPIVTGR
jgi:hypothetical protein